MFLDIFVIVVSLLAVLHGWSNGFVKELVSMAGFLLGFIVACFCYSLFGEYLMVEGTTLNVILGIVAFFIIWIIVPILCGVVATTLTAGLRLIPVVGFLNNLGGMVVSLVKYTLLLSLVLNAMGALRILNNERVSGSQLYEPVTAVTGLMKDAVVDKFEASHAATTDMTEVGESADTIWIDVKHQ